MKERDRLIEEADTKLDRNDFKGAVEAYRSAALRAEPTPHLLGNLDIAEDYERLVFRSRLSHEFPNSSAIHLSEAELLIMINRPATALQICTELLASQDGEQEQELPVRLLRLRAAARSHDYQMFHDDFAVIWLAAEKTQHAISFRRSLLRQVASISDPEAVATLESLAEEVAVSLEARGFLLAKIAELRALKIALGSTPAVTRNAPMQLTDDTAELGHQEDASRGPG